MGVQGELPQRKNLRGGAGWWMDLDGVWRPPEQWPEDTPPLDGWERGVDGRWCPPLLEEVVDPSLRVPEAEEPEQRQLAARTMSRQAESDRRAMFLVVGALGGAALLLVGALLLITQAGALGNGDGPATTQPEVLVKAETEGVRASIRQEVAAEAPNVAKDQLEELVVRTEETSFDVFDPQDWTPNEAGCLDLAEEVLVARSNIPVTWADQLECVLDVGLWTDRYLGRKINRAIDASVEPLVPMQVAYASGGNLWSPATQQAFVTDTDHPAALHVVYEDGGHNPRNADPSAWKPSNQSTWCAYAVDWVAVKHRWSLSVTEAERVELGLMLDTCENVNSDGADANSMLLSPLPAPEITLREPTG